MEGVTSFHSMRVSDAPLDTDRPYRRFATCIVSVSVLAAVLLFLAVHDAQPQSAQVRGSFARASSTKATTFDGRLDEISAALKREHRGLSKAEANEIAQWFALEVAKHQSAAKQQQEEVDFESRLRQISNALKREHRRLTTAEADEIARRFALEVVWHQMATQRAARGADAAMKEKAISECQNLGCVDRVLFGDKPDYDEAYPKGMPPEMSG